MSSEHRTYEHIILNHRCLRLPRNAQTRQLKKPSGDNAHNSIHYLPYIDGTTNEIHVNKHGMSPDPPPHVHETGGMMSDACAKNASKRALANNS